MYKWKPVLTDFANQWYQKVIHQTFLVQMILEILSPIDFIGRLPRCQTGNCTSKNNISNKTHTRLNFLKRENRQKIPNSNTLLNITKPSSRKLNSMENNNKVFQKKCTRNYFFLIKYNQINCTCYI